MQMKASLSSNVKRPRVVDFSTFTEEELEDLQFTSYLKIQVPEID